LRFEGGGAYIKIAMNRILAEDTLGFFFFGFGRFELSVEEWIEWTSQTNTRLKASKLRSDSRKARPPVRELDGTPHTSFQSCARR
jgi:hypothetical protein